MKRYIAKPDGYSSGVYNLYTPVKVCDIDGNIVYIPNFLEVNKLIDLEELKNGFEKNILDIEAKKDAILLCQKGEVNG